YARRSTGSVQMRVPGAGSVKSVRCDRVRVQIQRLDGRDAGEQVTIPEAAATAWQRAPVEGGRRSAVRRRQRRGKIRGQGDDQAARQFEERTGAMNVSRDPDVAALVVDDRAGRRLRELR